VRPWPILGIVYELLTDDASIIRPFPPCEGMVVKALHTTPRGALLLVVHENHEFTVLDGRTWAVVAEGPAPPQPTEDEDRVPPVLDWSGAWVGAAVQNGVDLCETVALSVLRVSEAAEGSWTTSDAFSLEVPWSVDVMAPVPGVPAAWLIAASSWMLYARVDPTRGFLCDVVGGAGEDFEVCSVKRVLSIHPVSDTAMMVVFRYAPEDVGGCNYYCETWPLPDLVLRDQSEVRVDMK
jgi:hypothetical protein